MTYTAKTGTAAENYREWTSDFDGVKDVIRLSARVNAAMAEVQAKLLRTQTLSVTQITDRMAEINDLMKMMNTWSANAKDDQRFRAKTGTQTEMADLKARFVAAGVDASLIEFNAITDTPTPPTHELVMTKAKIATSVSSMQITVDSLSSTTQQAQLSLQTLMGRYNGTYELVTASNKKAETQAESAINNFKKG